MKLHTTEELRHLQTTGEFPVSTFPVLNAKYSDRWDKAKELCEQFTQPLFWIDAHMHVNGDRNQSEQKITFEKIHEKNNEVNYEGNIWGWNQDYYYKNEKNDPSYYTLRKKLYINGGSRVSADNYKFSNPIFDYWLDFYDDMYPIVEHYARSNFTDINKFIHRLCIIEYSYPTATPEDYIEQREFNTVVFGQEHCDAQLGGLHLGENQSEYEAQNSVTGEYEKIPGLDNDSFLWMWGEFSENYGWKPTFHRMIHNPDPKFGTRYSLICNVVVDEKWQK